MSSDSFYVVLPSNAQEGNTPSRFLTTLQNPIAIDNPEEWEVGLLEVNFKNALKTIYKDKVEVHHTVYDYPERKVNGTLRDALPDHHNFYQNKMTWTDSFVMKGGIHDEGVKITEIYAVPVPKGEKGVKKSFLKSDLKDTPDFLFEYSDGRMHIVNNLSTAINISIPNYFAVMFGFIPKGITFHIYSLDKYKIKNIQPGRTTAPHDVFSFSKKQTEGLVHYMPSFPAFVTTYVLTYDIEYLTRTPTTTKVATLSPKPGKYDNGKKLEEELVDAEFNKFFKLKYDERLNSFKLLTIKPSDIMNVYEIKFIGGIHEVLGFKKTSYSNLPTSSETMSDLQIDLERGVSNIFLYCDLCQQIRVGNTSAPLLRPLAFNTHRYGEMVHTHFVNPMYVPINKSFIDTIEIKMCDAIGDPIAFVEGLTTVILHFKRV